MLVLSRRKTEGIIIGDDIEIIVLDVIEKKVLFGLQAPQKIPVYKKELLDLNHKIKASQSDAVIMYLKNGEIRILKKQKDKEIYMFSQINDNRVYALNRQKGEIIIIGGDIQISVVDIRITDKGEDVVRLGISAPKTVSVHRKEVYESIKQEILNDKKEQLPVLSVVPLTLLIDTGTATAEDLGELFLEISYLYQLRGGSGIVFKPTESKNLVTA